VSAKKRTGSYGKKKIAELRYGNAGSHKTAVTLDNKHSFIKVNGDLSRYSVCLYIIENVMNNVLNLNIN
jgi:hypothetical protein